MIVNYSLRQAIASCHHARNIGLSSVLLWRSYDHNANKVLLVIPFALGLHYGIFNEKYIRVIDL